jgi:hypothetical protein
MSKQEIENNLGKAKAYPTVNTLRSIDSERHEDATPYAAASPPPSDAARIRAGEHLFVLFDLSDPEATHLARDLHQVVTQTYWSSSGSITAALRRAITAANRYLFNLNLNATPSERCYGGLTCAVFHDNDLFILQAGPTQAYFLQDDNLTSFPRDEKLAHLGIGPMADVRLYHVFPEVGHTLLLVSPTWAQQMNEQGLMRLLQRPDPNSILEGVEQVGAGVAVTALVVRWEREQAPSPEKPRPAETPAPASTTSQPQKRPTGKTIIGQRRSESETSVPEEPAPRPKPAFKDRSKRILNRMKGGLGAVSGGLRAAGQWLLKALSALFQRMLPGAEQPARRQERARPVPEENRTLMMILAFGIPILMVIVLIVARLKFGTASQFQEVLSRAEEKATLAQAAPEGSEEALNHWEATLELTEAAIRLQPENQTAAQLRDQAQAALDRAAGVHWLTANQLVDFGSRSTARRLVAHGQTIFVIDPIDSWVAQVSINQAGNGLAQEEVPPIIAHSGKQVGTDSIGALIDCVWMNRGGGRQTSALLILEEDGALLNYDPSWMDAAGTAQLKRSFLGTPPRGTPKVVGSYEGRFYILDTTADGSGQIWRYKPQGDKYPDLPERYFTNPPPKSLEGAVDMAIDGHIYVLYADGTILKFLGGTPQSFNIQGLPDGLGEVVALALEPVDSDLVYIADRGGERVVVLNAEGVFQAQFRAEGAFDDLEALAMNETMSHMYVLNSGQLYALPLP